MTEDKVRALMELAGIPVQSLHKIENKYWPEAYVEMRKESPWWLIQAPFGLIEIGRRKRVISINWENTKVRAIVTDDDVTKDETMAHAWNYIQALAYLTTLNNHAIAAEKREG